jgi:hypothetical protein
MPAGRPTKFCKELALKVCVRIASGESLREVCRDPKLDISRESIRHWLLEGAEESASQEKKDFLCQYEAAERLRTDELFDEILDIAHDGSNDWLEREDKKGKTYVALNSEAVARSRLRVDTLKWALSKIMPKRFGDRVEQHHSGDVTINAADELILALTAKKDEEKDD